MTATTIQKILEDAARKKVFFKKTEQSMFWFRERARRTNINASRLIREYQGPPRRGSKVVSPTNDEAPTRHRTTSQLRIGCMYMYMYDPKWKKTLPYYDRFPIIFITDRHANGWSGINLHYLPYKQRAVLMDYLYALENKTNIPENKRLILSYNILKAARTSKWFRPCYKRYLTRHVRSKLIKVPYQEWHVAAFLPVQDFEKKSAKEVWQESLRKSRS